jgi:hypothetical protein
MGLPNPVTTTDEILVAIHSELVAIRGALGGGEDSPAVSSTKGPVELTEPAPKPAARKRTPSK